MLYGRLGWWSVVLLLISVDQTHATDMEATTNQGCFMNVSVLVYRTGIVYRRKSTGWWFWRRTSTVSSSKLELATEIRVRSCNTTTLGMSSDPATQVPSTGVNDSDLSNDTDALSGQQDDQPPSGQIAGFVIGVIAIVTIIIVIIVAVVFIRRKRKRKESQKPNMPVVSSSENSAEATAYYEPPDVIRERKRRQKVTNQNGSDLSSNQIGSGGDVTGSGQTVYSYNHLRESDDLHRGGDLAANTYDHLHGDHETQLEDEGETNPYYNVETTGTSSKAGSVLNTEYDNLKHKTVLGQNKSNDVTRCDYDQVQI